MSLCHLRETLQRKVQAAHNLFSPHRLTFSFLLPSTRSATVTASLSEDEAQRPNYKRFAKVRPTALFKTPQKAIPRSNLTLSLPTRAQTRHAYAPGPAAEVIALQPHTGVETDVECSERLCAVRLQFDDVLWPSPIEPNMPLVP